MIGPLLDFFVMLVSHGIAELVNALVSTAEHTLLLSDRAKTISESTLVTAEIAMKTAENTQTLADQAALKNG